jgi:hypothetical protein
MRSEGVYTANRVLGVPHVGEVSVELIDVRADNGFKELAWGHALFKDFLGGAWRSRIISRISCRSNKKPFQRQAKSPVSRKALFARRFVRKIRSVFNALILARNS